MVPIEDMLCLRRGILKQRFLWLNSTCIAIVVARLELIMLRQRVEIPSSPVDILQNSCLRFIECSHYMSRSSKRWGKRIQIKFCSICSETAVGQENFVHSNSLLSSQLFVSPSILVVSISKSVFQMYSVCPLILYYIFVLISIFPYIPYTRSHFASIASSDRY